MTNKIHNVHTVYNVSYHIIWIPKYRKRILTEDVKSSLIKYLLEKASKLNIMIESYEIMPDHVHLFVKAKPSISIANIVKNLKGYTSFMLISYPMVGLLLLNI